MPYNNQTLPKIQFDSNVRTPVKLSIGSKHYIVPMWVEVSSDFNVDKAVRDRLIVNTFDFSVKTTTNQWNIIGSTGTEYLVEFNSSGSYSCNCMGFRRAKDGKCRHIKQVIAENC